MATRAKTEAKPADPRGKIVDALMKLAGERRFEDISIREICREAGVTLADFRFARELHCVALTLAFLRPSSLPPPPPPPALL